ncbi:NUMOD3 domain-containing DNA-binding protein [Candidatus Pacearchaeota archaeon]|jgi:hypothetical protein|nr:NUMOD3 domain-containing DNA-binding protein [Candidatus Pacearchaeota archaeon]
MVCVIYVISNTINSKVYVGQTWRGVEKRFTNHKNDKRFCIKLVRAFAKLGKDNFSAKHLAYCETQAQADSSEIWFIKYFDSIKQGYNIRGGGSRGKMSEDTKRKISKAHIGLNTWTRGSKASQETKDKLSGLLIGNTRRCGKLASKETKSRMSLSRIGNKNRLGIKHSEETKAKISKTSSGANNGNSKTNYDTACQIRDDAKTIKSQRTLALKYRLSKTTIGRILRNECWTK